MKICLKPAPGSRRGRATRGPRVFFALGALLLFLIAQPSPLPAAPPARRLLLPKGGKAVSLMLKPELRMQHAGDHVAKVQLLPGGQLLLTPLDQSGSMTLYLATDKEFEVWEVRVGEDPEREAPSPALVKAIREACPGKVTRLPGDSVATSASDEPKLELEVKTEACLAALDPVVRTLLRREVALHFDETGLRAQLARSDKALKAWQGKDGPELMMGFLGSTLKIKGALGSRHSFDALRRALYDASVGPFFLDQSSIELPERGLEKSPTPPPPDAPSRALGSKPRRPGYPF